MLAAPQTQPRSRFASMPLSWSIAQRPLVPQALPLTVSCMPRRPAPPPVLRRPARFCMPSISRRPVGVGPFVLRRRLLVALRVALLFGGEARAMDAPAFLPKPWLRTSRQQRPQLRSVSKGFRLSRARARVACSRCLDVVPVSLSLRQVQRPALVHTRPRQRGAPVQHLEAPPEEGAHHGRCGVGVRPPRLFFVVARPCALSVGVAPFLIFS